MIEFIKPYFIAFLTCFFIYATYAKTIECPIRRAIHSLEFTIFFGILSYIISQY